MYSSLIKYLKRPALYERTTEKFWNNPYIASQMLKAHLNPGTDAASRRPEFITKCVQWVTSIAPTGANLLDIGCGPGLYTKQFAEHGLRVTGLDFSENSIEYARRNDPCSVYIVQDYFAMNFECMFDIITLIYFDYGALIPDERHELLRCVYRALKPGGMFLFDVYTPQRGKDKHDNTSWSTYPNGGFWSTAPHICLNASFYYGETGECRRTMIIDESATACYNIWDCYFTKQSLLNEATPFGFLEHSFYDDATGQTYTGNAHTLCAVLKKGE